MRVLTGDQRRAAEPNPDAALFVVAISLLGITSGLAGFVAIFVVAGTFTYAVAARRRTGQPTPPGSATYLEDNLQK